MTYAPELGRHVHLRPRTSDQQVWKETFAGLHHIPPDGTPTPATILDLGANIGLVAAHYQALWPNARLVAVEMDKGCCDLIDRNAPGVEVVCAAVSAVRGLGSYDPSEAAYRREFRRGNHHGTPVVGLTMADIIGAYFDGPVDLVKMDVEGAEWGLFARADEWAPLVTRLLAELHGPGDRNVRRATNLLRWAGYTVQRHIGHPQAVWATR